MVRGPVWGFEHSGVRWKPTPHLHTFYSSHSGLKKQGNRQIPPAELIASPLNCFPWELDLISDTPSYLTHVSLPLIFASATPFQTLSNSNSSSFLRLFYLGHKTSCFLLSLSQNPEHPFTSHQNQHWLAQVWTFHSLQRLAEFRLEWLNEPESNVLGMAFSDS